MDISLLLPPCLPKGGGGNYQETFGLEGPQRLSDRIWEGRTHKHPQSTPRNWGPSTWPSREVQDQEEKTSAVLNGLFWGTEEASFLNIFPVLILPSPPQYLFLFSGFVSMDEGGFRLCHSCLKKAKMIMVVIGNLCIHHVLHRCQSTSRALDSAVSI